MYYIINIEPYRKGINMNEPQLPSLGIILPETIENLKFHGSQNYDDNPESNGLGYGTSLGYSNEIASASIYEYTLNKGDISDGILSIDAIQEFFDSINEITESENQGMYYYTKFLEHRIFAYEQYYLCAISIIQKKQDDEFVLSTVFLTVHKGNFIKIRYTLPFPLDDDDDNNNDEAYRFVEVISLLLRDCDGN